MAAFSIECSKSRKKSDWETFWRRIEGLVDVIQILGELARLGAMIDTAEEPILRLPGGEPDPGVLRVAQAPHRPAIGVVARRGTKHEVVHDRIFADRALALRHLRQRGAKVVGDDEAAIVSFQPKHFMRRSRAAPEVERMGLGVVVMHFDDRRVAEFGTDLRFQIVGFAAEFL